MNATEFTYTKLVQKRINISLDPELHKLAKSHARKNHATDFSGLVTKLLVADIGPALEKESQEGSTALTDYAEYLLEKRKKDVHARAKAFMDKAGAPKKRPQAARRHPPSAKG